MEIRRYTQEDCSEILELFYETVHNVNKRDYSQIQLDAWADGRADAQAWNLGLLKNTAYVAVENGRIVGFGDITADGFLDRLYVHKDCQRHGIASAICDLLERAVYTQKYVTHASVTARPFFEKRGYQVIRSQEVERKGILLKNYVMEKRAESAENVETIDSAFCNDCKNLI